jgi:hypothetical protein
MAVQSASNDDPDMKAVGERPQEMAGRKQEHVPQFDFEDLGGWTLACSNGARAKLVRTRQQQMWGQFVGKLTYEGDSSKSEIHILPPKPIAVPPDATTVSLWLLSADHFAAKDVTQAAVSARLEDVNGKSCDVDLCTLKSISYYGWRWILVQKRLPDTVRAAKLMSLVVRKCSNPKPKQLYLDDLAFFREAMPPLKFKYTLDQIKKEVPFPTTPDTILPPSSTSCENAVRRDADGYIFSCKTDHEVLEYRYEPARGTLSGLTVVHNGTTVFRPAVDGGPMLLVDGKQLHADSPSIRRDLLHCDLADGVLCTRWRYRVGDTSAGAEMRLRIKNRSLIVDFASKNGAFVALSLGHSDDTPGAKAVEVPYLAFFRAKGEPCVLCWQGLFATAMLDWYNSNASQLYGASGEAGPGKVSFNGGSNYTPRTDGTRNPLRERLFITVSPVFSDVLPNIPNPPSPMREVLAPRCRLRLDLPPDSPLPRLSTYLARLRQYKAYGLDNLLVEFIEVHQKGKMNRGKGDNAWLEELVRQTKRLGYDRVSIYSEYTEDPTTRADFSSDKIARLPDGDWNANCVPGSYCYKSMWAVQLQEILGPPVHRKFGTTASFVDVATAVPPWSRMDYDSRVPGAAMFASYFYPFGKLLLNERKACAGPVYSEGSMHWMYAGLVDGNRAEVRPKGRTGWQVPLLVDFDLLRIHPLEADNGAGPLGICPMRLEGLAQDPGHAVDNVLFRSPASDRALAATIAFGHAGDFRHITSVDGPSDKNIWRMVNTYYMIQQIQQRYLMVPVADIRYHHDGKLLTTSEAIATNAYQQSQVYVKYTNGLEVYVNGNWDKPWQVNLASHSYHLPPAGFVAAMPDALLAYSADADGNRIDYVNSPAYVYADARGKSHDFPELSTNGAVAVKRHAQSLTAIIASPDVTELSLNVVRLLPHAITGEVVVQARDEEGNTIRRGKCPVAAGRISIPVEEKAVSYHLEAAKDY